MFGRFEESKERKHLDLLNCRGAMGIERARQTKTGDLTICKMDNPILNPEDLSFALAIVSDPKKYNVVLSGKGQPMRDHSGNRRYR